MKKNKICSITAIYLVMGIFFFLVDKIAGQIFGITKNLMLIDLAAWLIFVILTSVINLRQLKKLIDFTGKLQDVNEQLEKTNALMASIMESSPEIIIYSLDCNYCYTSFNSLHRKVVKAIWGTDVEIGMNLLEEAIVNGEYRFRAKVNLDRVLKGESFTVEESHESKNFPKTHWQSYFSPIKNKEGEIIGITCFVLDITELKKKEEENRLLSYYDQLTGVSNRRYYDEYFEKIDTDENYPLALIVADLDGLKFTNDVFGHEAGDQLIKIFADILKSICRKDDMVARIGGDEFVVLLPKTNASQMEEVILHIKEKTMSASFEKCIVSASFGGTVKTSSHEVLAQIFKEADDIMYDDKINHKKQFEDSLIKQINAVLYEDNPMEQKHKVQVAELCRKIAIELGFTKDQVVLAETAGALHDIGKVILDRKVLLKPGKLSVIEWKDVKRHSEIGYKILNYFNRYKDASEYVLFHHERMDGTGYPAGMNGSEIPIISRIICIADAYHAMTNNGIYRDTMTVEEAAQEIKKNAGTQFDGEIARIFIEKVLGLDW